MSMLPGELPRNERSTLGKTGAGSIAPLEAGALNLPNAITLVRLVLSIALFALIDRGGLWLTSAALFVFAASTDFLDGYYARKYGQVTTLGRILDPFVDKIIIGGAFVFLVEKQSVVGPNGATFSSGVNAWMAIIVIGREMFITSLRAFLEQHGRDFSAAWSGKIKMGLQCAAVTASLLSLSPDLGAQNWLIIARDVLLWSAVISTLVSGASYVRRAAEMLRA